MIGGYDLLILSDYLLNFPVFFFFSKKCHENKIILSQIEPPLDPLLASEKFNVRKIVICQHFNFYEHAQLS